MVTSIYDGIRLVAYAVIVLVLAFQKTKTVLMADAIFASSVVGMMFVYPKMWQMQLTQPLDNFHILLGQFAGSFYLLFILFYFFFLRGAKDEDAKNGYLVSRTIAVGLLTIVTAINEWRFAGIFKDTYFPMVMLMCVMWTCLLAYHLYINGVTPPRRGRISPINLYIKIDVVLALLLSVPDLLYASYNKNFVSFPMDNVHLHFVTSIAAVHLATAVFGIYALGFRNITERKGYLCCRVTIVLLNVVFFLYTLVIKKVNMTWTETAFTSVMFIPAVTATVGLFLTGDQRTFTSSSGGGYNLRTRSR